MHLDCILTFSPKQPS